MFRAIYSSSKDFYYIVSAISRLTDKMILNFTDSGINSKYLTEDKVMMGVVDITREALDEYSIEKPISVQLELGDLKKILSKMKGRSSIEILETEGGIRIIVRDERSGTRSSLNLKADKGEVQNMKEPGVSHNVNLSIDGEVLRTLIDEGMQIGEEAEIRTKDQAVEFNVEDAGKKYVALLRPEKPLSRLEIIRDTDSRYSLPVLEKITSSLSFSKELEVAFGSGIPLKVSAVLEKGATLRFWVAPRL
ncbi:DNA polymerase sliding clamp [Metallosphaera tengchongensis]|uniref:DNA polymerase sliding clamp n=1 Tax=Metallosphaera tengchongensis TaxID=1532350 RepID=A0A6N0NXI6_9CREN|nr:DNA polymerase sliding clamp [Metallosphaera tengchongensis]QKQ99819.1 DNA polymerase sliding clamp [Metallosphaera tengchongensis]